MSQLTFFKYWFKGFEKFLESSSRDEVEPVLQHCAEACSESMTLDLYKEAFSRNYSLEKSMLFLKNSLEDFHYKIFDSHLEITYSRCDCDLYITDLVKSSKLCICSEKSLLYNWESVYGRGNVKVKRNESILDGGQKCKFTVKVAALGHF